MAQMFGGMPVPSPQRRLPSRGGMPSGPVQGLQAAQPPTMGGGMPPGRPGAGAMGAAQNANRNTMLQSQRQPFLNPGGGMTYATGPEPTAMGQAGGRSIYGFGPDGNPIFTPQTDYVQFAPGEGPGIAAPRNTGVTGGGQPEGPMGGLIGALPVLPRQPEMPRVDDTQAAAEAYARAKDVAGQQGRAALDALQDIQGARGIIGSGLGVNEAGGVIGEAARQLGDFNRDQMIQRIENERRRQEINYQGGISQRGQDYTGRAQELERRRWNAQNSPRGTYQY